MTRQKPAQDLFLISFLVIYFEILCIRWIPAQLSFVGLFTNFVLIACFLGLGVGCLVTWLQRRILLAFPFLFSILVGAVLAFRHVRILAHSTEVVFLDKRDRLMDMNIWVALTFFYVLVGLVFTTLGQEVGLLFRQLPRIKAYSVNIFGSLVGMAAFNVLSFTGMPSSVWLVIGLGLLAYYCRDQKKFLVVHLLLSALCLAATLHADRGQTWSPYHKISFAPLQMNMITGNPYPFEKGLKPEDVYTFTPETGFNILVNGLYYQAPVDLSDKSMETNKLLRHIRYQRDIPYKVGSNKRVLICGGGSGNDAAAALRNGAEKVDVVDIDPGLVGIGRARHPEKPYQDPRVTVYIDDARNFFKSSRGHREYDKIAFGWLDSHIQFSSLSTLRIDSYVYTMESFREASRLLGPEGIIVCNFTLASPRFSHKLYRMLEEGTGTTPVILSDLQPNPLGVALIAGPGVAKLFPGVPRPAIAADVIPSTDDWPFFYLLRRQIGGDYLTALFFMLSISTVMVVAAGRQRKRGVQLHFFCLGAAFMLLETKSITTLALVFGSTWLVNSVVISCVLLMILLANLYVLKVRVTGLGPYYAGLALALAGSYLLPVSAMDGWSQATRMVVGSLVTFLPIFFAGIVFATSFSLTQEPDYALGSNILGGVLGGALEYLSMVIGFRLLLVLVAALYAISYLAAPRVELAED